MKTFAELDAKICSCTEALNQKIDGSNGKRAILLCGGTGCLSSNSMEIKEKFEKLIAENNMGDKVPYIHFIFKPDCFFFTTPCLPWLPSVFTTAPRHILGLMGSR